MRLIDARRLIKTWDTSKSMVDNVDAQPTIDAVPVVRCKDCKHCQESEYPDEYYCTWHSGEENEFEVFVDDYCSCGERN